jgi:hypothetical protein
LTKRKLAHQFFKRATLTVEEICANFSKIDLARHLLSPDYVSSKNAARSIQRPVI